MRSIPPNLTIAILLALAPLPAMKALDHINRGCGDGLCGFFPGLLILGGLAIGTLIFIGRSVRRGEQPEALRPAPLVLWALALLPLIF